MTTMELITILYCSTFVFIGFGIACLVAYLTNPKHWHEVVAESVTVIIVVAALFAVLVLGWSIGPLQ